MTTFRKHDERIAREDWSEYFNDFFGYTAADWVINTTEAGSGSATEAISDAANGILLITNDDADDDADHLQWAKETFKFVAGKKLMFKMRFKTSNATESDLVFGLHILDTSPIASAPTDGIYFRKDDGDKLLDFVVAKNSTASTLTGIAASLTELANDTWVVVEFYYDGVDSIHAYINGTRVGALPVTNAPDDEELSVSFAIMNGSAGAKTLSIDYILARQQR